MSVSQIVNEKQEERKRRKEKKGKKLFVMRIEDLMILHEMKRFENKL